jgi:Uri superfamily endonuclease
MLCVRPEAEPAPGLPRREHGLPERGVYLFWLHIPVERLLCIGALGTWRFPAGWYVYVGSAQRALPARLKRHLALEKKCRWHIDYLRPYGVITSCAAACADKSAECLAARRLLELPAASVVVPGFGSSDCRCPAHLLYFPIRPAVYHDPAVILPSFQIVPPADLAGSISAPPLQPAGC